MSLLDRICGKARSDHDARKIPPVLRPDELAELDSRRWTPRQCYGCGQTACRCPGAPQ